MEAVKVYCGAMFLLVLRQCENTYATNMDYGSNAESRFLRELGPNDVIFPFWQPRRYRLACLGSSLKLVRFVGIDGWQTDWLPNGPSALSVSRHTWELRHASANSLRSSTHAS